MNEIREFLNRKIKPDVLKRLIKEYNISNVKETDDITFFGLLTVVVINKAREGDKKAAELVEKYNLHE